MKPIDKYKDKIMWNNPRLKKSIRLIIYFSEILPKKFLNTHFGDSNLRMRIVSTSNLNSPKEGIDSANNIQNDLGLTWREPYIVHMDENFEDIMETLYESRFIDRIFANGGNAISKSEWDTAIVGSLMGNFFGDAIDLIDGEESNREKEMLKDMEEGALDWLFSPKKIRLAFKRRDQAE